MYCEKCGNRLEADSVFCTSCGARVSDDNYVEEYYYTEDDNNDVEDYDYTRDDNIDIKNIFNNVDFFNGMCSFGSSQKNTLLASKGLSQSNNRRLKIEASYEFIKNFLREKNYGVFIGMAFMLEMRAKLTGDKKDLANSFSSAAYIREIKMALAFQKKEKEMGYEKFIQLALNDVRIASNIGYTAEYLFIFKDRFK